MARTVTIDEARANLAHFAKKAAEGEEVILTEGGRPVARLAPVVERTGRRRQPGSMRGMIWIADDFDDPLPKDVLDSFLGDG